MSPMKQATIFARDIYKNFQLNDQNLSVIKGISFKFNQDTSYAITGSSGSGKSTLMHILGGFDAPSAGHIFFNDYQYRYDQCDNHALLIRNKYVGFVFQSPYLIKELSVVENVMLKGLIQGLPYEQAHKKAQVLLELVGLAEKANCLPHQLSGGQQQRVAVLRGLFNEPAFLLADEPTANLDHKTARNLIDFLIDCKTEWGLGLLVSTHDFNLVDRMQMQLRLEDGILLNNFIQTPDLNARISFGNIHK